ncbi:hypothetical protein [Lactococcus garvieae]|uniref:hypothetical protein n=1 Tax=Lactococcus garvieae TaxID=1363 RepID=UPI000374F185|nr:hypothetical protein [Lactococcus garvieae]
MKKYTVQLMGQEYFLKKIGSNRQTKFVHVPLTCVPSHYSNFVFDDMELENVMRGSLYRREFHSCDFTKTCTEADCRYERFNPAFIFEEVVEEK